MTSTGRSLGEALKPTLWKQGSKTDDNQQHGGEGAGEGEGERGGGGGRDEHDIHTDTESHTASGGMAMKHALPTGDQQSEYNKETQQQGQQQQQGQESSSTTAEHQQAKQELTTHSNPGMSDHIEKSELSSSTATPLSPTVSSPVSIVSGLKSVGVPNTDSWVSVQSKTFLRWCNYYLSQRSLSVSSVSESFTDGHMLNNLIEILSKRKIGKWKHPPIKSQVQALDNLSITFSALQQDGVKLVNIRPQEIQAGNAKITLALLWSMIVHYQIEKTSKAHREKKRQTDEARAAAGTVTPTNNETAANPISGEPPLARRDSLLGSAKAELLAWVNSKIDVYAVPPVTDFSSSFADGKALFALTDALVVEQKALTANKGSSEQQQTEHKEQRNLTLVQSHHMHSTLVAILGSMLILLLCVSSSVSQTGDPIVDAAAAINRADTELRIPALIDASDLVNQPQEQAVMTYIACFRDREQSGTAAGGGVTAFIDKQTEKTEESPRAAAPPAVAVPIIHDFPLSSLIQGPPIPTPTPVPTTTITSTSSALPPVQIASFSELAARAGLVEGVATTTNSTSTTISNQPIEPAVTSAETTTNNTMSTVTLPELQTEDTEQHPVTHPPPSTPVHDDKDADDEKTAATSGASTVSASTPVADQTFSSAPVSSPIVRTESLKEVDVCMTNADLQYVQAKPDGHLTVSAANTSWSVWTVIDSQATDIVYFRDHKGRYITSDGDGHVFMAPKSEQSKWTVHRGKVQNFKNYQGLYLTAKDGRVYCDSVGGPFAALTLNFPVIEGILRKKGRSGLKRWQNRYFAFNGAVMSYWPNKESAGINSPPKGVYYPADISSVCTDPHAETRFFIKFKDGQTSALDAVTKQECHRWVHSLQMTGIKLTAL